MDRPVLVLDDEYYVTRAISFLLKEEGLKCVTKNDSEDLYEILDRDHPKVVFLDINMPKKNGFEICKEIRANEKYDDIKIVFLTARGQEDDIKKGLDLGAESYILKPFNPIELLEMVKTMYKD